MTTSDEHKPEADDSTSYDGWREAVVLARRERRQRGESYLAAHGPKVSALAVRFGASMEG
jgi:hypothetical protein